MAAGIFFSALLPPTCRAWVRLKSRSRDNMRASFAGVIVESKVKETETLLVQSEADIYAAIGQGRLLAGKIGFEHIDQTRLETIIAELARNALMHGGGGTVTLRWIERNTLSKGKVQVGLEIVVEDYGSGIADLAQALAGGHSTVGGLGVGIPSVRRLADEFAIDSAPGRGTRVRTCKWVRVSRSCEAGDQSR